MDRLPLGRFHRRLLALIGAGMFLDGFEIYLTAAVLVALVKSGWSDMAHNAAFISLTFLGMVIGAWAAGILGDRYGRRFTYQFNLLLFGGGSLLAAFSPNMQVLLALRFVMGMGLGAEIVAGYATLTEFVPASHRGRMIGWLAVITNSSLFVSTFLGMWLIPAFGWRVMFGIVGVAAMIIWALRKNMPESPRWLEIQGRHEEANFVVARMEAECGVVFSADSRQASSTRYSAPKREQVSVWSVFKPPILRRTLLGILLNIVTGFCLYGFINWLPTFLVKQGVSTASSLLWTAVMGIGAPAGALLGMFLSDRVGRKPVIIGASLWAAFLGILFAHCGVDANGKGLMLTGFLLYIGVYVLMAVGFALHVPELFRTEYRLRGTAVCGTAGRIATACVQYVVVWLFMIGGLTGVVSLLVGLLLVQAVAFAVFGMETAKRSLESIDQDEPEEASIPSSVHVRRPQ